jgi:hypothetical protein
MGGSRVEAERGPRKNVELLGNHFEKDVTMKKTILATAVALALSSGLAMAQSGQMQGGATAAPSSSPSEHGSKVNKHPGTTTGSSARMHGNNAELKGNNGNSASGSNSLTNNNNLGNGN